jgi:adenosylmethionine-8-amino-7-oxononanoate aminotransferase
VSLILVFAILAGASLNTVSQLAGKYAILVIFGVIMSGTGRTGSPTAV